VSQLNHRSASAWRVPVKALKRASLRSSRHSQPMSGPRSNWPGFAAAQRVSRVIAFTCQHGGDCCEGEQDGALHRPGSLVSPTAWHRRSSSDPAARRRGTCSFAGPQSKMYARRSHRGNEKNTSGDNAPARADPDTEASLPRSRQRLATGRRLTAWSARAARSGGPCAAPATTRTRRRRAGTCGPGSPPHSASRARSLRRALP
jgi:hypothetical protein